MPAAFAFVETLTGVAAARSRPDTRLATDNPLLAHDPRVGGDVLDISAHLKQDEATRLGRGAIDILLELDRLLDRHGAAERFGGRPGPLNVTMSLRALLTTLVQRGVMAQRALADFGAGPLLLYAPDQPRWTPSAPWNVPRFGSPHRALAEAGFFDNRPVEFVPVTFSPPTGFNDTSTDDFWMRVLLVPPAQALFELAKRLRLTEARNGARIAIGKTSEALNETLPWLAARGLRFRSFRLPVYPGPEAPAFGTACRADAWLEEIVGAFLVERIAQLGVFPDHSARAVATVLLQHLSAGLSRLAEATKAIDSAIEQTFNGARAPRILMTSGIYGPVGRQLHAVCRERGVTLIDFEHGTTTGLAHTTERRLQVSEATTCDILMASSERASSSFRRAPTESCDIRVVGLADQTRRVHWQSLQRTRARQRLKINGGGPTIMHVSTLLYGGNVRSGDDNSVEHYVFDTEKRLLCDVYGAVNRQVLYKPYPTQRFPHDASYAALLELPPNVRLIERADFRYVRAAADIIVTNANQSTLGWCIGAGVPLVRLCSRFVQDLVNEEVNEAVAEAFFTIDMDSADWPHRLIDLLKRDMSDLRREWDAKKTAREHFLTDYICGPPGSAGRRAAKIVAALHG
jgi:hypothetical protein